MNVLDMVQRTFRLNFVCLLSFGSLLISGRLALVDMSKVAKIAQALSIPIEVLIK